MITLTTLIIAGAILAACVLASFFVPHPVVWIATLIMGITFFVGLLPRYQGEQQALQSGVTVSAAVSEVRHWSRKSGDGNYTDQYEILALAPHPETGEMRQFVSPPLNEDPAPHLGESVNITVDWQNPKAYVMDLSFLPNPPK
ncbi:MAG: hypothetical protein Q4D82_05245 [Neisseria sp.]|nr:hypothetical protein [Neisseria sp.]